jgi:hypothetical protein
VDASDDRSGDLAKIDKDAFALGALRALEQLNLLPASSEKHLSRLRLSSGGETADIGTVS